MRKPFDIGDGYSCASYLLSGAVLALTRPHATHGMVELTGAPAFDETARQHPDLVRAYRASLTRAETAVIGPAGPASVRHARIDDAGALRLTVEFTGEQDTVSFAFRGRLQRPPYAEITDIAPLPPLADDTELSVRGAALVVSSATLDTTATIEPVAADGLGGRWELDGIGGAAWHGMGRTMTPTTIDLVLTLTTAHDPPRQLTGSPQSRRHDEARTRALDVGGLIAGIADYIRGCCALRVTGTETVIITDHRLLPLSWTRDAYYMALLLLLLDEEGDAAIVERHLAWLWGSARRAGAWMRSHLTNGDVKDPGLQGDQQLFPILELLDYRSATGAWPRAPHPERSWGSLVEEALAALPIDAGTGLIESHENPADDPAEYPLLLSTQLLYLRVLEGVAGRAGELGLSPVVFNARAAVVWESITAAFTTEGPDGVVFAYEADGTGSHRLYGDANDIPTALAPAWGFCGVDDPTWARTMRYIFSPANPGWAPGRLGGLGSAHTAGVWPLGDVQAYIVRTLSGDAEGAGAVLEKLLSLAADDGHLPESYDGETGEWLARHWFGWPAAALACAVLSHGRLTPASPARIKEIFRQ